LVPSDAEGWVPEHFYAEVLATLRRRALIQKLITEAQATTAGTRLRSWRFHEVSVAPLVQSAWGYRHNMTAADAIYVVRLSAFMSTSSLTTTTWSTHLHFHPT